MEAIEIDALQFLMKKIGRNFGKNRKRNMGEEINGIIEKMKSA